MDLLQANVSTEGVVWPVTRTITTTKIIAMTATFDFTITSLTKSVGVLDPINMFWALKWPGLDFEYCDHSYPIHCQLSPVVHLLPSRGQPSTLWMVPSLPGEPISKNWFFNTGWSLKTVDFNFFLTDPKNSKSAKTQWFSESLYREVLVFWCFKIVRCVNFASRSFSNIEHLLHHTGPDHSYTTLYAFKP